MIGSLGLAGCGGSQTERPRPTATVTVAPKPVELTVGLFGAPQEIAAYRQAVDNYAAAQQQRVTLTLKTWPSAAAMMTDLAGGAPVPDVFLAGRGDLGVLQQDKLIQPVEDLLAARNVDLGDAYSREALEAFSSDRHLACMPYAASPEVLYYNTDLVDFEAMAAAGHDVPNPESGRWSLEQFAEAVQWAARPRAGIRAVALPADVAGLAPFLYSGHGKVVDDEDAPSTLAFSDPDNQSLWDQLLPILNGPGVGLTRRELHQHTPLSWFERGKLAMLVGDRSLVPTLRKHSDLHWDVIALPTVSDSVTLGDYTGLCMSAATKQTQAAGDLLAYLVSRPAVALVAQAGFMVPASTEVGMSDDFLQPTQRPTHAQVFVNAMRSMHVLPIPSTFLADLDRRTSGLIGDLFRPGANVPGLTQQIDAASQPVLAALDAQLHPSPTPTPTPGG